MTFLEFIKLDERLITQFTKVEMLLRELGFNYKIEDDIKFKDFKFEDIVVRVFNNYKIEVFKNDVNIASINGIDALRKTIKNNLK